MKTVNGLYNFIILNDNDKSEILRLEDSWNLGVKECLNRDVVILVVPNSLFEEHKKEVIKRLSLFERIALFFKILFGR